MYRTYRGDGLRHMGHYEREVYLPTHDLAFYVDYQGLRVFRPDKWRYGHPETEPFEIEGKTVHMPVWSDPSTDARFVGEIRVGRADGERLVGMLRSREEFARDLEKYFPDEGPRPVARWTRQNGEADAWVSRTLREQGLTFTVKEDDSWRVAWVDYARAEDARSALKYQRYYAGPDGGRPEPGRRDLDFEIVPAGKTD